MWPPGIIGISEMATPETEIAFTVGDQERLKEIEILQKKALEKLDHLPCMPGNDTPCPNEGWIRAVEKKVDGTRNWVAGVIAVLFSAGVIGLASAILTHLAKGG